VPRAAPGKWVAAFLEADAAEIRLRAERRLGLMIEAQKETVGLNEGGRPKPGYVGGAGFEKPARSLDCERAKECAGADQLERCLRCGLHGATLRMALTGSLRTQSVALNAHAVTGTAFRVVTVTAGLT
jgi:hypothetical protein